MHIKRVNTAKHYKKDYVLIDNYIVSKENALIVWPEFKMQILNAIEQNDDNVFKAPEVVYPEFFEMINQIAKATEDIYKKFNFTTVNSTKEKLVQAGILYNYVGQDFNWDYRAIEELFFERELFDYNLKEEKYFLNKINQVIGELTKDKDENFKNYAINKFKQFSAHQKQLYLLNKKHPQKTNKASYDDIVCKKAKLYNSLLNNANKESQLTIKNLKQLDLHYKISFQRRIDEQVFFSNLQTVKQVYNGLVLKRGVCTQLAFAYSYLLDGLEISNNLVGLINENNLAGHIVNVIEDEEKNGMVFCDLSVATAFSDDCKKYNKFNDIKTNINGFAIDFKDILKKDANYKIASITKIEQFMFNSNEDKYDIWNLTTYDKEQIEDFKSTFLQKEQYEQVRDLIKEKLSTNENTR